MTLLDWPLLLRHEGVSNALHAVHGADEGDGSASAHHQAQVSGVLGQLVWVVRVPEILDGVVQDNVEQGIEPLQSPTGLPASSKLDTDLLVYEPEWEVSHLSYCQIVDKIYLLRSRIDSFFFLSPPSTVLLGADIFLSYFLKLTESQPWSNISLLIFQSRISFPLGAPSDRCLEELSKPGEGFQ